MPSNDHQKLRQAVNRPLVLVGMMGAGKTHVGRLLAAALDLPFHDMDGLIEEKAGMSIPEIFGTYGEEKFRDAESNTLRELLEQGPSIVSTGGGVILRSENLQRIKNGSVMIWLDAPIEILWERLKDNKTRPLLHTADPKGTLMQLLQTRKEFYEQAHVHCKIGGEAAESVLANLINILSETLNSDTFQGN